jgi:hypothetical protein
MITPPIYDKLIYLSVNGAGGKKKNLTRNDKRFFQIYERLEKAGPIVSRIILSGNKFLARGSRSSYYAI